MPSTSLGGWFDKVFFDAHGEPCASGELRFYQTWTDIPQGVATFDGTPLGAVIRLDDDGRPESDFRFYTDKIYRVVLFAADGTRVKQIDGVSVPAGEGGGMSNPMTDPGDLIFGGPAGAPLRRGIGDDGDILAVALYGGFLSPKWEAGPKKYRVVYGNVPSPQIDDGYLGCLFYLSGYAQTLELPSAANIPSKAFIDFMFLDNAATLTITPQGGTVLNAQGSAVTIGGQAASMYRLTFLGHGGSGDEWALGGSGDGDHKTAVDGADASPDYLAAKLAAGSGISLTNTGSAVEITADAQTGDHQLLVSATDAAAGYLGAKLTAGANVTLTPQTDGDGVQTLEISATGGGGGGGDVLDWSLGSSAMCYTYSQPTQSNTYFQAFLTARKGTPKGIFIAGMNGFSWANTTVRVALYEYDFNAAGTQLCYGQLSNTANPSGDVLFVPFTSTQEIVMGKRLWLAFCLTARGNIRIPYVQVNESSFNRFKTTAITSGDTLSVAGSSGTIQGYECGVYY